MFSDLINSFVTSTKSSSARHSFGETSHHDESAGDSLYSTTIRYYDYQGRASPYNSLSRLSRRKLSEEGEGVDVKKTPQKLTHTGFSYRKRGKFYRFNGTDNVELETDATCNSSSVGELSQRQEDDSSTEENYSSICSHNQKHETSLPSIYIPHNNPGRNSHTELSEETIDADAVVEQPHENDSDELTAAGKQGLRRRLPSETGMGIKSNEYGDNITPWRDQSLGLSLPNEDPDEKWIDGFLNRPCMPTLHRTDTAWMLGCGIRVLSMQTGFALLEAGSVERSHATDVMMKNFMDLILGPVSYWYLGYRMAFGVECEMKKRKKTVASGSLPTDEMEEYEICSDWGNGFIGALIVTKPIPVREYANWFFQYSFAATSSTIVSGMIAERCTMLSYLLSSLFIVSVIYPIGSHWVWSEHGWLNKLGFKDFAGGAVVHMVGAAAGFVFCKNIGNRNHWKQKMNHNPHNIIFGTIVLWVGWYGFNCGSTLGMSSGLDLEAAKVALNTTMAASLAGTLAYLWAFFVRKDYHTEYNLVSGGLLAGLVCVTPAADVLSPDLALLYGFVGFMAHIVTDKVMEEYLEVDDVVKAMAVHGAPGCLGTLMIGIPGLTMGNCFTGDLTGKFKFEIQLLGVVAITLSTVIVMQFWLLFLRFVCRIDLRCSEEYERIGRVDALSRNRVKASTQISRLTARLATMELARRRDNDKIVKLTRKVNRRGGGGGGGGKSGGDSSKKKNKKDKNSGVSAATVALDNSKPVVLKLDEAVDIDAVILEREKNENQNSTDAADTADTVLNPDSSPRPNYGNTHDDSEDAPPDPAPRLSNASLAGNLRVSASGYLLRRGSSSLHERSSFENLDEKEISRLQIEELEDVKKYGSSEEAVKAKERKAAKEGKKNGSAKKTADKSSLTKKKNHSSDSAKKSPAISASDIDSAEDLDDSDENTNFDTDSYNNSFSDAELDVKELQELKRDELKKLVEKEMRVLRRNSSVGSITNDIMGAAAAGAAMTTVDSEVKPIGIEAMLGANPGA